MKKKNKDKIKNLDKKKEKLEDKTKKWEKKLNKHFQKPPKMRSSKNKLLTAIIQELERSNKLNREWINSNREPVVDLKKLNINLEGDIIKGNIEYDEVGRMEFTTDNVWMVYMYLHSLRYIGTNKFRKQVKFAKMHEDAKQPKMAHYDDACYDIYSLEELTLEPKTTVPVMARTGLAMEIPFGYEAQIRMRSGLASKYGCYIANMMGTIDAGYRDEIKILVVNPSDLEMVIKKHERFAQMAIRVVPKSCLSEVKYEELSESKRGLGGFGSTGK